MIRLVGAGPRPGALTPHASFIRRYYCPGAKCSSPEGLIAAAISIARKCMIRQVGPGLRPGALTPRALIIRRRYCPAARCWSPEDLMAPLSRARSCMILLVGAG